MSEVVDAEEGRGQGEGHGHCKSVLLFGHVSLSWGDGKRTTTTMVMMQNIGMMEPCWGIDKGNGRCQCGEGTGVGAVSVWVRGSPRG